MAVVYAPTLVFAPKRKLFKPKYYESGVSLVNTVSNPYASVLDPYKPMLFVPKRKLIVTKSETGLSLANAINNPASQIIG